MLNSACGILTRQRFTCARRALAFSTEMVLSTCSTWRIMEFRSSARAQETLTVTPQILRVGWWLMPAILSRAVAWTVPSRTLRTWNSIRWQLFNTFPTRFSRKRRQPLTCECRWKTFADLNNEYSSSPCKQVRQHIRSTVQDFVHWTSDSTLWSS